MSLKPDESEDCSHSPVIILGKAVKLGKRRRALFSAMIRNVARVKPVSCRGYLHAQSILYGCGTGVCGRGLRLIWAIFLWVRAGCYQLSDKRLTGIDVGDEEEGQR